MSPPLLARRSRVAPVIDAAVIAAGFLRSLRFALTLGAARLAAWRAALLRWAGTLFALAYALWRLVERERAEPDALVRA